MDKIMRYAVLILLFVAAGCSSIQEMKQDVDREHERIARYIQKEAPKPEQKRLVHEIDGVWLGRKTISDESYEVLPPIFSKTIVLMFPDRVNLSTVAERITKVTGVRVRLNPDVFIPATDLNPVSVSSSTAANDATDSAAVPAASTDTTTLTTTNDYDVILTLNYVGTLPNILDSITARAGISWEYKDGTVHFYRLVTQSFTLKALPGSMEVKASIGKAANSGSTTTGTETESTGVASFSSSTETKSNIAFSVWSEIEGAIRAILTPLGKVNISQSTGTIVVTDTKEAVEKVATLVDNENRMVGRQVRINVEVLSVVTDDSQNYGIDWDVIYNKISDLASHSWNVTTSSPVLSLSDSAHTGSLGLSILTNTSGDPRKWEGSNVIFKALADIGKVSVVTKTPITTSNNQPATFALTDQTGYLAKTEPATSTDGGIGGTPGLTPGVVTTGFILNLMPTILDNSKILMQFSLDISELKRINTVTSGDQSIETPEITSQQFLQRINLRRGETLAMTLFERNSDQYDKRGLTKDASIGLGGSFDGTKKKETIVVLLTPELLEGA